ncbi:FAD dependent oxidoreductase [Prosthecobacter debontii]|uniref:FAD dependent oxidoreductase n=2 Tax=Prosthecobacter debontii TaxID=48467 RepID=A0A1T4YGM0_9BACT|nr:FAD dependent oxidoreductase [Prosthecobacter debontii]
MWGVAVSSLSASDPIKTEYDLVVVEATPGGIATAVRAAREGLSVLLLNRTQHLGGILANGLGVWDTQYEGKRSPIYDEVRRSIMEHYRTTYGEKSPQYQAAQPGKSGHTNGRFEARVAERILTELVHREPNITVLKGFVPVKLEREGRLLTKLHLAAWGQPDTPLEIQAASYADCSYEGDLLPLAGVEYRVGRESRDEYQEPHAGRIYMQASKTPPDEATAQMAEKHDRLNLRQFPGFQIIVKPESTGEGDSNVQAFNYRTTLTSDPANRLPVEKPADYDPEFLKTLEFGSIVSPLPNQKIGWNRPQLIGPHQAYVEGDWKTRRQVMDQHWNATMGLLYFLQNDPSVTPERRKFFGAYGLAKDEFVDNGHRPHEFYVREARRLRGRYVITQHDFMLKLGADRAPAHADSIAFAEWYMDTHACTPGKVGTSLDEGKMMLHHETFPAQVPYRALLPSEVDNLIVPVCVSSTHVAWGAIRLEPIWMQIGESAGYACALAKQTETTLAGVETIHLVRKLAESRSMISFFNDVDVSRAQDGGTAALIFAGRGFFPGYDAKLGAPATEALAKVWLTEALVPIPEDAVAEQMKQRVQEAEMMESPPLTREAWERIGGPSSMPTPTNPQTALDVLSRGDLLDELLARMRW